MAQLVHSDQKPTHAVARPASNTWIKAVAWFLMGVVIGFAVIGRAAPSQKAEQRRRLAEIAQRLSTEQETIAQARTRSAQIETELHELAIKKAGSSQRLSSRVHALYRLRQAGMLPLAGGFEALLKHLSRVHRLTRILQRDLEEINHLERHRQALSTEQSELGEALNAAEQSMIELNADRLRIEEEKRMAALLADTLRQREDLRAMSDAGGQGAKFLELRGNLALPIQGQLRVRDAVRGESQGVEFVTRAGASARSAASGRVAFSGRHGDYGRMVVVDHGNAYYTVYAGLGRSDLEVGDWVGSSSLIGTVAAGNPSALFFEVRKSQRSLAARAWLGL